MTTAAIIGPDGAGKSTVIRRVLEQLPVPARSIYMGVNLEASRLMLPTTRLALELKRRRGGRPDMVGSAAAPGGRRGPLREVRSGLRLANWVAEEWFRQAVAWYQERRGRVVLFDRHFLLDYYANDVLGRRPGRPWTSRLHGRMLKRWFPRPDLVIFLDAPAETLFARKGESTVEALEQKRREFLALRSVFDGFHVIDATQDTDAVVRDVIATIVAALDPPSPARPSPSAGDDLQETAA